MKAALITALLALHQQPSGSLKIPHPAFQDNEWNVMAQLFQPKTGLGRAWAKNLLQQGASSDLRQLEERQKLVRYFLERPKQLAQLSKLTEEFAKYEETLLSSFDAKASVNGQDIQLLYFHDEQLNEKLGPGALQLAMQGNTNWMPAFYKFLLQYSFLPLLILSSYYQAKWILQEDAWGWSKYFYAIWTPLQLNDALSNPLSGHYELLTAYDKLARPIHAYADVIDVLFRAQAVGLDIDEIDQNNFAYFVKMAREVSLDDGHLFQKSLAKALAAFRVYMELRKPLAKYLERFAKLDFYASVARTLNEHPEHVTFVTWLSPGDPILLRATSLWNPILASDAVVKNNITIDNHSRQIMLTGPNASGKSTFMKAVAMNAHLAHTIGVVAASEFAIQPLSYVHSLVTHYDRTGELSAYQMELRNIKQVLEMLSKGPGLLILDEPFRSTNLRDAEIASRRVLNRLCAYPNLGVMVSTHLSALTEGEAPCVRVNKHMQNYALQEGAFTGSNSLEILRRELAK